MDNTMLIPIERIEKAIYLIRSEKVMLDRDLAALYGVTTKALKTVCEAQHLAVPRRLYVCP